MEIPQSSFADWAIVEQMGHNKYAGYVTSQAFGAAVLFRVDIPEIPEEEIELKEPEYIVGRGRMPTGTKLKQERVPAYTKLIGPNSIFAMTPCDEPTVMVALRAMQLRPFILLSVPQGQLTAAQQDPAEYSDPEENAEGFEL